MNLGTKEKIHVVGHGLGAMIAHAHASMRPDHVASVVYGECPLPGITLYENIKNSFKVFHFTFRGVPDLPKGLVVEGERERSNLMRFYDKLLLDPSVISIADLEHYAGLYSQSGALRCASDMYRAFERDAEEMPICRIPAAAVKFFRSFKIEN
jgi:pimeloyl-ACP methyl ester carboxylesterase